MCTKKWQSSLRENNIFPTSVVAFSPKSSFFLIFLHNTTSLTIVIWHLISVSSSQLNPHGFNRHVYILSQYDIQYANYLPCNWHLLNNFFLPLQVSAPTARRRVSVPSTESCGTEQQSGPLRNSPGRPATACTIHTPRRQLSRGALPLPHHTCGPPSTRGQQPLWPLEDLLWTLLHCRVSVRWEIKDKWVRYLIFKAIWIGILMTYH